jgi:hypothetical protein
VMILRPLILPTVAFQPCKWRITACRRSIYCFLFPTTGDEFGNCPRTRFDSCGLAGRHAQRTVCFAKIVIREIQRNRSFKVSNFLLKGFPDNFQQRESAARLPLKGQDDFAAPFCIFGKHCSKRPKTLRSSSWERFSFIFPATLRASKWSHPSKQLLGSRAPLMNLVDPQQH